MLTTEKIKELFAALNEELAAKDVIGEVGICGGAVMCLVFQTREATKDVDAIFEPAQEIREASARVAKRLEVPEDWLNDAVKGFFYSEPPRTDVLNLSHLRIWAPAADYMLAMKCLSARFDSHDGNDVTFLIKHLKLENPEQAFDIVEKYCPKQVIPAKTRFFIEELFSKE